MRKGPKRHVVVDVETIRDPLIPAKQTGDDSRPFEPPIVWQIVALGCMSFQDFEPEQIGCLRGETEQAKVAAYAAYLESDRPIVVTWNGRFFDCPVIGHRALRFGIPMPWWYGSPKGPRYRYGEQAIDLKDALADHGATTTSDLNQAARLVGWPGKGEITGADVASLHAAGQLAAIESYCLTDVAQLAAVWLRFELLRGNVKPKEWPRIAHRLLVFLEKHGATRELAAAVDRALYVGPDCTQLTLSS